MAEGDESGTWWDDFTSFTTGKADDAMKAATEAVDDLPYNVFMGQLDNIIDGSVIDGELLTWVPPGTNFGMATPRKVEVLPLGWGAVAGVAGVILFWLFKG